MRGFDSRHPLHRRTALQHKHIRLFPSSRSKLIHVRNGSRAITRALSHLDQCPWRPSVAKLTVQVRFPSPAPHAQGGRSSCSGEELLHCANAAGYAEATRLPGRHAAFGRSRPPPPKAPQTHRKDEGRLNRRRDRPTSKELAHEHEPHDAPL